MKMKFGPGGSECNLACHWWYTGILALSWSYCLTELQEASQQKHYLGLPRELIMAMALPTLPSISSSIPQRIEVRPVNSRVLNFSIASKMQSDGRGRRVWRRRKLRKKDDMLQYKMDRIPFLEEQVRKIREGGKLLTMDIHRLLLSEDNRFDFVNEVAAEAKEYVERNRDEYGGAKKAILHVLSNRVNDAGFYRPDGYAESDPYKPGPGFLKEEFT